MTSRSGIPRFGRARWYAGSPYGTTVFRPSLPPDSSTTTRMRSGCFSTLVPWSACAVSAAVVRETNIGRAAPTPIPYRPRVRKSRREQLHAIRHLCCLIRSDLTELVLRRAQHQIEQLAQRRLQLFARPQLGRAEPVPEKADEDGPFLLAEADTQEPAKAHVDSLVHRRRVRVGQDLRQVDRGNAPRDRLRSL